MLQQIVYHGHPSTHLGMIHHLIHQSGETSVPLDQVGWGWPGFTTLEAMEQDSWVLEGQRQGITVTTPTSFQGYLAEWPANQMSSSISQGVQTPPLTLPLSFGPLVIIPT